MQKKREGFVVALLAGATLLAVGMMSCTPVDKPKAEAVVPEYNGGLNPPKKITIPSFDWYIMSKAELRAVYERSDMEVPPGAELHGFTGIHNGKRVVITAPPATVDDDATLTLGHEVMHIAFGDYHQ